MNIPVIFFLLRYPNRLSPGLEMAEDFEYCVVGGGVIGSAAAYLLSREGRSVVVFEQFELGHERGSSHGESRITRYSYDHPTYVRMAKRAYPLWDEIMKESGEPLFLKTGGIDLDEDGGQRLDACISSMKLEGINYEVLDAQEINKRFPQFNIPSHTLGLFQADTGILNAQLCMKTLQLLAKKHGARFLESTPVVRLEYEGKGVKITSNSQQIKAKKLILAAGGWMGPLLLGYGVKLPLEVTQEQYAFFQPLKPAEFEPGRFPVFIHYGGVGSGGIGWYGFPIFGRAGVKSSIHKSGKTVTADSRDFEADTNKLAELHEHMKHLLPDAAGEIIHATTCLYTNTPDTHFVIDRLPGHDNAVFFTGCSGHSFKFGAVIAEILIALLAKKDPIVSLQLFSRKRFSALVV